MSDWKFLNEHRVREGPYGSDDAEGFNGLFRFLIAPNHIRCIASDGMGWRHVSVSLEYDRRCPRWELMCMVKDLFWDDDDWVVQYHPAKKDNVSFHPYCLHLWQPTAEYLPRPLKIMVGPTTNH